MKRLLFISILMHEILFAQVGIHTANPQGVFHIDGQRNNPSTGTPSVTQQVDDFIVTSGGDVGIGTTSPDISSALEIKTTSKGFLLPRLTNAERNTISSPATGLLIFSTTDNCIQTNISTPVAPNWGCLSNQNGGGNAVVQVNSYTPNTATGSLASEICLGSICVRHNGVANEGSILLKSNTGSSIPNTSVARFQVATSGINEGNTSINTLSNNYIYSVL